MLYRRLGKSGIQISELSLGTWQVGGKWGSDFDNKNAEQIINTAIDNGINFIDTADVYSDGLSEKAVGRVIKSRSEKVYVASKCGRKISPHVNEGFLPNILRKYVEESLTRLGIERIDLIQLHCPPTEVYYRPEIFELFDQLMSEGKIGHLGVSVEKVEEGIKAIEYDNVTSVQIVYNMFRQRPDELFFNMAQKKNVGIIVRVPLASGLLTGLYTKSTSFSKGDHRFFNRNGEAFDKGETFSGIDYETGLAAIERLKELFPGRKNLAPIAIKWILQYHGIATVIPGASRPEQVLSNLEAITEKDISDEVMFKIYELYKEMIRDDVHHLW